MRPPRIAQQGRSRRAAGRTGGASGALVTAATASYVLNCAWGTAVAVRIIRTRRLRLVHHALFVSTASLTVAAVAAPLWTRSRASLFLLPALVPLALAPRVDARSRAHWSVAIAAAPSYLGAMLGLCRKER